jgi:hypothetical protein
VQFLALEEKLTPILEGKSSPASPEEALALARLCQHPARALHAAAANFYAEAFAGKPDLAGDLQSGHRYNAACAAALAAGQARAEKECARLRQQALDWLKADLAAWGKWLKSNQPGEADHARRALAGWRTNPDLAGVRQQEALGGLPEGQRQAWREFWKGLEAVLGPPIQPPRAPAEPRSV